MADTPKQDMQNEQDTAPVGAVVESVESQEDQPGRVPASGIFWGTGRRKCSVARVRVTPGSGKIIVNKKPYDVFFTELKSQADVVAPLHTTNTMGRWDVFVTVNGGGFTGQSGAVRMGLARALCDADTRFELKLRQDGHLTRDARIVERKKYGRRKARRRFQFSKR